MSTPIDSVPIYTLYGEHDLADSADFIHIEPIASRSRDREWKITPHRHGRMLQLIVLYRGAVEASLDDQHLTSDDPACLIIPPGVVHGFEFAPDTQGVVLTVAETLLMREELAPCRPYFDSLLGHTDLLHFDPESELYHQLKRYLTDLQTEFNSLYAGRRSMCEWLVRLVLMTVARQRNHQGAIARDNTELVTTLHDFRQLIEDHYLDHWKVEDYATALNVTPHRLNRLCRLGMHKNAKSLIQERLTVEAKRKLIYTRGNVDQIAFDLGFADPGYFSRFFKRHVGESPKEYRGRY